MQLFLVRVDRKRAPLLNASLFLLGFVTELRNETRDQLAEMCSNGSGGFLDQIAARQKPVVGVIGDQSSDISIQVHSFRGKLPQCDAASRCE